jgi:hypothetical protein
VDIELVQPVLITIAKGIAQVNWNDNYNNPCNGMEEQRNFFI